MHSILCTTTPNERWNKSNITKIKSQMQPIVNKKKKKSNEQTREGKRSRAKGKKKKVKNTSQITRKCESGNLSHRRNHAKQQTYTKKKRQIQRKKLNCNASATDFLSFLLLQYEIPRPNTIAGSDQEICPSTIVFEFKIFGFIVFDSVVFFFFLHPFNFYAMIHILTLTLALATLFARKHLFCIEIF